MRSVWWRPGVRNSSPSVPVRPIGPVHGKLFGDRMTGTMTSPVDTLGVSGTRQAGFPYGGDEPAQYTATRTGVLGLRTDLLPPENEADPVGWVRSRVTSLSGHPRVWVRGAGQWREAAR